MRKLSLAVFALLSAAGAGIAHADGSLAVRTVYYKETATRVEQPMLDGIFDVGTRGTLTAHVLIDAITSASAGSGAANATPFTEHRYEGAVGYMHQLDRRLHLGGDFKYSTESDYRSIYFGGRGELDLAQKNFILTGGAGISIDRVSAAAAQGPSMPTIDCTPNDSSTASNACPLHVLNGYIAASQIVSRHALVAISYDIARLDGYQANPYRLVVTNTGFAPETHPDERLRQDIAVSARLYVPQTQTTFIPAYRYYYDNWEIHAHTPEIRIVQQAGDYIDAAIRYRYYHQSASFFYAPRYTSTDPSMNNPAFGGYMTDDPKMSEFTGHELEAKLGVLGQAFELGGDWANARFEGILEYIIQGNRFGNAAIAQFAVTLPFSYLRAHRGARARVRGHRVLRRRRHADVRARQRRRRPRRDRRRQQRHAHLRQPHRRPQQRLPERGCAGGHRQLDDRRHADQRQRRDHPVRGPSRSARDPAARPRPRCRELARPGRRSRRHVRRLHVRARSDHAADRHAERERLVRRRQRCRGLRDHGQWHGLAVADVR